MPASNIKLPVGKPKGKGKGSKDVKKERVNPRLVKRQAFEKQLEELEKEVAEFEGNPATFKELPLTTETAKGLQASHFTALTSIQQKALPLALKGRDVLGAAKTGSGKTLAFLIPVLEILFRKRWTSLDGLGALIISPTRELAVQIFEVLRQIGRYHTFSAGLVIGGKNVQEEKERLARMNILVCTPGRMVQHMSETSGFDTDNLQILVLDEADRCLEMGFKAAIDAIVENLPKDRQTLLFSATQTQSLSDLARLSLKDPEYVGVHDKAVAATPTTLQQYYITTPLPEKLDVLYSFLRSHLTHKILVFFSSCKQVRFVYETFRKLHIGIPLLHLHGKQKQTARNEITGRFSEATKTCLFATDIVARGLDFPAVDWVIQVDCPEDASTYIHRVGRTARMNKDGSAVLFLCPNEAPGFLKRLEAKKIPIVETKVTEKKKQSIKNHLQAICFKDPTIKYLGQKAFVSYTKSIFIQKDKTTFDYDQLPLDEFALSLGLPGTPNVVIKRSNAGNKDIKDLKNRSRKLMKEVENAASSSDEASGDEDGEEKKKKEKKKPEVRTKYDRMFERKNQTVLAEHYNKLIVKNTAEEDDEEGDFLSVKRILAPQDIAEEADKHSGVGAAKAAGLKTLVIPGAAPLIIDSKRREKLLTHKKELLKHKPKGQKLLFDDDGVAHPAYEMHNLESFRKDGDAEEQRRKFVEVEREVVGREDEVDRKVAKDKRREKREKRKERERVEREGGVVSASAGYGAGEDDDDDDEGVEAGMGGLKLIPFVDYGNGDESDDGRDGTATPPPQEKKRKWFQKGNSSDEDEDENVHQSRKKALKKRSGSNKVVEIGDEPPQALGDLEKLAEQLLW
ncbi:P-loop containing nucleoside triphosphate hydrolase protein [Peziza echinospora]|nr:P-loop containing nucleoside triphosphate hydrolase protein [Peziza echinospora]